MARTGFVATVRLDKLSTKKNWQRRLRQNYTVLRVKGLKPGEKGDWNQWLDGLYRMIDFGRISRLRWFQWQSSFRAYISLVYPFYLRFFFYKITLSIAFFIQVRKRRRTSFKASSIIAIHRDVRNLAAFSASAILNEIITKGKYFLFFRTLCFVSSVSHVYTLQHVYPINARKHDMKLLQNPDSCLQYRFCFSHYSVSSFRYPEFPEGKSLNHISRL